MTATATRVTVLGLCATMACSSAPTAVAAGPDAGASSNVVETWGDGKILPASVTILPGDEVTVAPGATVTVGSGAIITVRGRLSASASDKHAQLTGAAWSGVVIGQGGVLALDGVDITGASTALDVRMGGSAVYDDGTIDGAQKPFEVEAGGSLSTHHASVTNPLGSSEVSGTFSASHLNYDAGSNSGIVTMAPTAVLSVEDSTLLGSGPAGDFLVSQRGAAKFHVAYTDISNVHCAFHFDTVSSFDISAVNVHQVAYGFMLYGSSGAGPFSMTGSNIDNSAGIAYDAEGQNAAISFDHCFIAGDARPGDAVTTTNAEPMRLSGTGPRP